MAWQRDPDRDPRPLEPDNLADDGLGPGADADRPDAPRPHGAVRDVGHPDFFTVDHRYLPDPVDPLDQPERRQVVDDYTTLTTGPGSVTDGAGGVDPVTGWDAVRADTPGDPRRHLPDAEAPAT